MTMPEKELDEGTLLVAQPGGWYDAGAIVTVVADCRWAGVLLRGSRNGVEDEELTGWDEVEPLS